MTRHLPATLLAATLATLAMSANAATPAKAITVNGKTIPASRIDALVAAQLAQGQTDTPQMQKSVREQLIQRELIVQASEKKGFDKKAEVQTQLALSRQNVLIGAYLQDFSKTHPVTDAMIQAEYDKLRAVLGDKEYKARHILLNSEDEAKAVIAKLKAGEKFEELAKQSKDPGSAQQGGELDWANKTSYVKPFSDALVALGKGKYTETPVQSGFGWHIIQLDDVRDLKVPSVEEIKPQLTQRVQQQMFEKHVAELRAKAKVE